MKNILYNQRGFSLVEILVALLLGGLLATAFTVAFVVGLQTEAGMDERLEATRVIDSVIEELRNEELNDEIDKDTIKALPSFKNDKLEIEELEEEEDNLYYIIISWPDRNYSTEALVTINKETAGENGGEDDNGSGENGNDDDNGNDKTLEHFGTPGNTIELKLKPDSASVIDYDINTTKSSHQQLEIIDETVTKNAEHNLFVISYDFDNSHNHQNRTATITYSLVGNDASITLEIKVSSNNNIVSIDEI